MLLAEVLDQADSLSLEEKEVFLEVFKNRLTEAKREQFYLNHQQAKKEYQEGKIKFSNDFAQLKEMLEHD